MALQGDAPPGPHAGLGQIPKVGTPPRGGFRAAARSRGGLAGRVSRNNLSNVTSISGSMATRTPAHPARTPKPPGAGSGGGSTANASTCLGTVETAAGTPRAFGA